MTDELASYQKLPYRLFVNHSKGEYVKWLAHTNGVESFWALAKRSLQGTYHQWSQQHLQRYLDEFAGRHNLRPLDTEMRMTVMVQQMVGKVLPFRVLAPARLRQFRFRSRRGRSRRFLRSTGTVLPEGSTTSDRAGPSLHG